MSIKTVSNIELRKLEKALEKAKNATMRKNAQKALSDYIASAFLVLKFQNDTKVLVFNAEKNARKYLRDNGYRTCLLEKKKDEKTLVRYWTHALEYTGKHDKITNDPNEYAIRDYEKDAMQAYMQAKEKAQKAKEKAQKEKA